MLDVGIRKELRALLDVRALLDAIRMRIKRCAILDAHHLPLLGAYARSRRPENGKAGTRSELRVSFSFILLEGISVAISASIVRFGWVVTPVLVYECKNGRTYRRS